MSAALKEQLISRLKQAGAFDVRVADPRRGFEHTLPKQHPLELWPDCKSIVVFAVAMAPEANNTYAGPRAPWPGERNLGPVPRDIESDDFAFDRLSRLFTASATLKGTIVLNNAGHQVKFVNPLALQVKLCAYEAGLGVYGRNGLILHPLIGTRLNIGTILTDAELPADPRLDDYAPCADCGRCVRRCPAQAFDAEKNYPASFTREKCISRRVQLAEEGLYCHNCFLVCPATRFADQDLLAIKEATVFQN